MNDDEVLAKVRSSLTGVTESMTDVRLDRPVDAIQARARGRRLRRGFGGACAGGLALGIGLVLAAGGGSAAPGSASGTRHVHVNLDAWSVNTLSNGLVYVDVRELQNPSLLRRTLADAGVPAIVTFGEFCTGPGGGGTENLRQILGKSAADGQARLTINPAGIPHGSELSIGIVSTSKGGIQGGLAAEFAVVRNGVHLTCGQPSPDPSPSGAGKAGAGKAGAGKAGAAKSGGNGAVKTGLGT